MNGLDIGDGFKISVEKAKFSSSNESSLPVEQIEEIIINDSRQLSSSIVESFKRSLPTDFSFVSAPLVVLVNAFGYEAQDDQIASIEVSSCLSIQLCLLITDRVVLS